MYFRYKLTVFRDLFGRFTLVCSCFDKIAEGPDSFCHNCTCRLRRYNYSHDQLNTRHFIIIFYDFLRGPGAQNLTLPPGARYPRYATGGNAVPTEFLMWERRSHAFPPHYTTVYGAPSDQFLCIIFGSPSQINFFSYYMGPPQINFFAYYMGAPQISFFAYYIWGPSEISFFAYYMMAPSDQFLCLVCGGPLDQSLCILFRGPHQISFFAYYTGPPQIIICLHTTTTCIWGPLKSVSSLTIWGTLRPVSSHTICPPPPKVTIAINYYQLVY